MTLASTRSQSVKKKVSIVKARPVIKAKAKPVAKGRPIVKARTKPVTKAKPVVKAKRESVLQAKARKPATPAKGSQTPKIAVKSKIIKAPAAVAAKHPVTSTRKSSEKKKLTATLTPAAHVSSAIKPTFPRYLRAPPVNPVDSIGLAGLDMGPLPSDEVFDETDSAQHMQLREIAETQRRARLLNQPEYDPSFDGKHCVECDVVIPKARLILNRIRCVECQQEIENTNKRREVLRR